LPTLDGPMRSAESGLDAARTGRQGTRRSRVTRSSGPRHRPAARRREAALSPVAASVRWDAQAIPRTDGRRLRRLTSQPCWAAKQASSRATSSGSDALRSARAAAATSAINAMPTTRNIALVKQADLRRKGGPQRSWLEHCTLNTDHQMAASSHNDIGRSPSWTCASWCRHRSIEAMRAPFYRRVDQRKSMWAKASMRNLQSVPGGIAHLGWTDAAPESRLDAARAGRQGTRRKPFHALGRFAASTSGTPARSGLDSGDRIGTLGCTGNPTTQRRRPRRLTSRCTEPSRSSIQPRPSTCVRSPQAAARGSMRSVAASSQPAVVWAARAVATLPAIPRTRWKRRQRHEGARAKRHVFLTPDGCADPAEPIALIVA
jgi:hypothetical protein